MGCINSNRYVILNCFVIITVILLLTMNNGPVSSSGIQPLASGSNLTISGYYNVTSIEIWDDVYILDGGKLNISSTGTLSVENMFLYNGSSLAVHGGTLTISNDTSGGGAKLEGYCNEFRVSRNSLVRIQGNTGGNTITSSQGGDASLDISCLNDVHIIDSSIDVNGGNGYDLSASSASSSKAWTTGTVKGYTSAGGNATVRIASKGSIDLTRCYLNLTGGRGGKASDGGSGTTTTTGKGGGYSNGGWVLENVGKGGNCSLTFCAQALNMNDTSISIKGGTGGAAGKGGAGGNAKASTSTSGKGGGGGGYGGGNGGAGGVNARVDGYVGSGGSCSGNIIVDGPVRSRNITLRIMGGNGGAAGNGGIPGLGDWASKAYLDNGGGGGGGGYGGGGGGNGRDYSGGDAYVGGNVGIGGMAYLFINGSEEILLERSILNCTGGNGGKAGIGGLGGPGLEYTGSGAPGGGGYGGGGGAGGSSKGWSDPSPTSKGGSTNVMGKIGCGGEADFHMNCLVFKVNDSEINTLGGTGGQAGNGGGAGTTGGGGGGYGGGGAGDNGNGGSGNVDGPVGKGGNSSLSITVKDFFLAGNSSIESIGGNGGKGGAGGSTSYSGVGGGGGGYSGDGGIRQNTKKNPGKGKVTGTVGDGGTSNITLICWKSVDFNNTHVLSRGGDGGIAPTSPGGGSSSCSGTGTGRKTYPGPTEYDIIGIPFAFLINGTGDIINRTITQSITIEVSDDSDDEDEMRCTVKLRTPSNSIIPLKTEYKGTSPSGSWVCNFTPAKTATTGLYLLEVSVEDTDGNRGPSTYYSFYVVNNLPLLNSIGYSNHSMLRSGSIDIEINVSDVEDGSSTLSVELECRGPTGDWVGINEGSFIGSNWTFKWPIGIDMTIGKYDIRSRVTDVDEGMSEWFVEEDVIEVRNNLPVLIHLNLSTGNLLRNNTLIVNVSVQDIENAKDDLSIILEYTSPRGPCVEILNGTFENETWTYYLNVNNSFELGNYSFQVNITDLDGNFTGDLLFYEILSVENNLPFLITDSLGNAIEDEEYLFNISAYDVETELLSVLLYSGPSWLTLDGLTLKGTPGNEDVGELSVVFSVDDGDNITYWTLKITVLNVNDGPQSNTTPKELCFEDMVYYLKLNAFDIDPTNDTLTWSMVTDADFLTLHEENWSIMGYPGNEDVGSYYVNLTLSDGNGGLFELSFYLEIVNVNDDPVITTAIIPEVVEDQRYVLVFEAYDIDPTNDTFTWSIQTECRYTSFDEVTGTLILDPENDDVGVFWVNVTVEDGKGGIDMISFYLEIVNVNDGPTIEPVDSQNILEDEFFSMQINGSDIDPTNDTLIWSMETDSRFLSIDEGTGSISGTPTNDDVGIFFVNITVEDGLGGSYYYFFYIKVENVNDAPQAIKKNHTITMDEDFELTLFLGSDFIDIDGDEIKFRVTGGGDHSIGINKTGYLTISLERNFHGEMELTVYANDSILEDSMKIFLMVLEVNDPPTDAQIVKLNLTSIEGGNHTVMGNASDVDMIDGDSLRFIWSSNVSGWIGEGAVINLSLVPGYHRINLTVMDLEGSATYAFLDVYIETLPVKEDAEHGPSGIIIALCIGALLLFLMIMLIIIFLIKRKRVTEDVLEEVLVIPEEGPMEKVERLRNKAREQGINISVGEMQYVQLVNLKKNNLTEAADKILPNYLKFLESMVKNENTQDATVAPQMVETPTVSSFSTPETPTTPEKGHTN